MIIRVYNYIKNFIYDWLFDFKIFIFEHNICTCVCMLNHSLSTLFSLYFFCLTKNENLLVISEYFSLPVLPDWAY